MPPSEPRIEDNKVVERVEVDGAAVTVVLTGAIDVVNAPDLRDSLDRCIASGCTEITLDMAAVSFMDSAACGALGSAVKALYPSGSLTVRDPRRPIRRLLGITGLSKVLTLEPKEP